MLCAGMTEDAIIIYTTCADDEEAKAIGRTLVEQAYVACANIIPSITSLYEWEGRLEESQEVILWLKTTADRFEPVKEAILAQHSYDCPCILSLPVGNGNPAFLDWIHTQTHSHSG